MFKAQHEQKDLIEYIAKLKAEAQIAQEEKNDVQRKLAEMQINVQQTQEANLRAMHADRQRLEMEALFR